MKLKPISIITIASLAVAMCVPSVLGARKKASPSPGASASPAQSAAASTTASASPSSSASPAASKAPRAIPFYGMISAVDQSAKTFTIAGKEKSRVFKVTDRTVITKSDQPATMKDITANQEVTGSYWKLADGSLEAKKVKLGAQIKSRAKAAASPAASASASPKKP